MNIKHEKMTNNELDNVSGGCGHDSDVMHCNNCGRTATLTPHKYKKGKWIWCPYCSTAEDTEKTAQIIGYK